MGSFIENYRDVPDIRLVESGVSGPTAAILACTHGNEPAGLEVMEYLLSDLRLLRGRLLFIIVNPEAAKRKVRYIDRNMNRLPRQRSDWKGTVEGARLEELWPILQEIDGGVLDIHSTSSASPPMLLAIDEAGLQAAQEPHSPFRRVVTGIEQHLCGRFIIEECRNAKLRLLAECGQHHCPEAASRGIAMSLSFLYSLGMIALPVAHSSTEKVMAYRVGHALHLPQEAVGFRLLKPIAPFEWLEVGQPVACNTQQQVCAPCSGYAIMCPQTDGILDNREALLFLCEHTN